MNEPDDPAEGGESSVLNRLLGVILLVISASLFLISAGPLFNLFADYRDSATSTYLIAGLPFLIGSLLAAGIGFYLLGKKDSHPG